MTTINQLITPELRSQLLSGVAFVENLNTALEPYGIKYQSGKTLSKMVKESAKYQALSKVEQTDFFNKIKSIFKAHHVGERLAVEAVARGFWGRFDKTTVFTKGENIGDVKTLGITFVAPSERASKEDGNIKVEQEKLVLSAENKRLQQRILELEAGTGEIKPSAE
jgi:hypothetical protein